MRGTERASSAGVLKVSPPTAGKVTHHNVELLVAKDEEPAQVDSKVTKISMTLQQQDKHGGWFTIYTLVDHPISLSLSLSLSVTIFMSLL